MSPKENLCHHQVNCHYTLREKREYISLSFILSSFTTTGQNQIGFFNQNGSNLLELWCFRMPMAALMNFLIALMKGNKGIPAHSHPTQTQKYSMYTGVGAIIAFNCQYRSWALLKKRNFCSFNTSASWIRIIIALTIHPGIVSLKWRHFQIKWIYTWISGIFACIENCL